MFKLNRFVTSIALLSAASLSLTGCNGGGEENQDTRTTDVVINSVPQGEQLEFSNDFLWGSATAAYQVEGATSEGGRGFTNWDLYTKQMRMANGETGDVAIDQYHRYKEDVKLMADAGLKSYRFSIAWSRIYPTGFPFQVDPVTGQPVLDPAGNIIQVAPNQAGVDYYSNLIDELIKYDIEPVITLFHWDIPVGLWAAGSFNNPLTVDMFAAYSKAVFMAYGDRVDKWITMNEPFINATLIEGLMAVVGKQAAETGETPSKDALTAIVKNLPLEDLVGTQMTYIHHYLLAHAKAVEIQRQLETSGEIIEGDIGLAFDLKIAKPASDSDADKAATELYNSLLNDWYVFPITRGYYPANVLSRLQADGHNFNMPADKVESDLKFMAQQGLDFLGVNYYSRSTISSEVFDSDLGSNRGFNGGNIWNEAYVHNPVEFPKSENGAYDPQGLYDTLMYLDKEGGGKPILITENGGGFRVEDKLTDGGEVKDPLRIRYINGHLRATWKAIDDGADVIGYTAWSLFDNFEWFNGYNGRFGMIYIDYENDLKRIPKSSYYWYKDTISKDGVKN
ncbi:family 1 glycosylhydrolase [Vibrio splendidus]|uniref:glycoside hydrolase family 1 protein n=1 Tax=Vibrio splendidus TaxID=29497 RepID=UPI0022357A3D|nr:family 1 glycosylhydrolase [Vibrio splendidus]MCW4446530.1 family 1 glycosylhydrolase [Vibrio splendidus]